MLIQKIDIEKYRDVSQSARADKLIKQAIQDCELLDLIPLIGEQLYNDLVANRTATKNIELMDGKSYEYQGKIYKTEGLRAVICHFAYARYIMNSGLVDTASGFVQKRNQDSDNSEYIELKRKSKMSFQVGYAYFKSVKDFLDRKTSEYEHWTCSSTKRNFMFSKITR